MKDLSLNHAKTPPLLQSVNKDIESLLLGDELDEAKLFALVEHRDDCINQYLQTIQGDALKEFAAAEIKVNDALTSHVTELFNVTRSELHGLIKSRKAVNKYK